MSTRPERVNTVQIVRRFYRSWWKRPFWLLGALALALVAGRIALTPVLITHLRQQLDQRVGKDIVTFRDLDVYLFPPTFVFKDVEVRAPGAGGESLQVPRAEFHAASWRALVTQPAPALRVRLERPALRLVSGSQDLDRIVRALPSARIEVANVSDGSIGNGSAPDGRPVLDRISGDVEGLASGTEVGKSKWRFWGDGQLLGKDPIHVVMSGDPAGRVRASLSGRQADAPIAAASKQAPAFTFDGEAAGTGGQLRGTMRVRWSGDTAPAVLSQDRSRGLDERWPATALRLVEVRPGVAADGGALEAVIDDGGVQPARPVDRAAHAVGLVVGMVRLGNRAIATPVRGVAALGEPGAGTSLPEQEAASYDSH